MTPIMTIRLWRRASTGFSLMEMAVVLMIMGVLMSGVLVSVSQTTLNARRATALAQLRQIEDALYGYAQSNGRLPCPATADGTGTATPAAGGTCTQRHGFVPAATLGFAGAINQDGLLLDPWQNPYRYSVADGSNPVYTTTASIDAFFNAGTTIITTNPGNSMMRICSATACAVSEVVTTIAPAVILSMGENWANTTSADELNNANSTAPIIGAVTGNRYLVNDDYDFVASDYIEDQFDDQLVWLSPYVLFNRMVSAGKLP